MNELMTTGPGVLTGDPFAHTEYTIRRPWLSFLGRKLYIHGPDGRVVLFVRHKLLTFKDEWMVYSDDTERVPLLRVKARAALKLNITTDVFDVETGACVGTVRSQGLKSIVRDTWDVLGEAEAVVGHFTEDSNALMRRFLPVLLGHWHMEHQGQRVAKLDQAWKWFSKEFKLQIVEPGVADTKFVIACSLLALMREMVRERS